MKARLNIIRWKEVKKMDAKTSIENFYNKLWYHVMDRNDKIGKIYVGDGNAYDQLAEISRHIELLISDLRDAMFWCHNELQSFGYCRDEIPIPDAPDITVNVEEKSVRIIMGGMLPFPQKGSVYYLHDKLDAALECHIRHNALPQPIFTERCAVVFIHRYAGADRARRNLRDYDNTERRCITNVIARHFMHDDSPACYISMDIIAPGDSNHTEIRIMTIPEFRAFVMSDKIDFTL
jgi:hypothetical protein